MNIELKRFVDNGHCTLGTLTVDGKGMAFTLEDIHRDVKLRGETRIPAGTYKMGLRNEGGMTGRYKGQFPEMHKGMLWLLDVPSYKYVYIHYGNYPANTNGCILVGSSADMLQSMVGNSVATYRSLYPKIADAIIAGEDVMIQVIDEIRGS